MNSVGQLLQSDLGQEFTRSTEIFKALETASEYHGAFLINHVNRILCTLLVHCDYLLMF